MGRKKNEERTIKGKKKEEREKGGERKGKERGMLDGKRTNPHPLRKGGGRKVRGEEG
jgi:hypothetical protein